MGKRLLLFISLFVLYVQAFVGQEVYKTNRNYNGSTIYSAGIKTDIFKYYAANQEYDSWCWAACVQMVLNYQGLYVEQKDLVKRAFGTVTNRGGTGYDIVKAANGWRVKEKTIVAQMGGKSQQGKRILIC